MANRDEILIFTDRDCNPCDLLKELLGKRPGVRFIDVNEPEAKNYIQGNEAFVPVAYTKGQFCRIEGNEQGIFLDCEGQTAQLCKMRTEGEDAFIDCGQGEEKL